mgnify:CR=1 FL=1
MQREGIARGGGLIDTIGDQHRDHGPAVPVPLLHQAQQVGGGGGIDGAERLVEQQDIGGGVEGTGKLDLLSV